MNAGLQIQCKVHFGCGRKTRKELRKGEAPAMEPTGRVPKVSRIMALAIRLDGLVRSGQVESYADLARLGYVDRSRVSQILTLLQLAPDIQEAILFLPKTERGRDAIKEKEVRAVARVVEWKRQRRLWKVMIA